MSATTSKLSANLSRSTTSTMNSSARKLNNSSSSSLSSHLAMVELKSRILAALSKLSDRDTHQIAVDDLENIIRTLPVDGVPVLINSLFHDPAVSLPSSESKNSPTIFRRETIRLVALLCTSHPDSASTHLPKIIFHITRCLKDPVSDSSVRDACRDAMGSLAGLYIRPATSNDEAAASTVASMFLKPLLDAMGEQNKGVQAGSAACLASLVDQGGASAGGVAAFQKLCPRICKWLSGQSFLAKGALLSVVSSLSRVGAINPQSMQLVLQNVRECLENNDWTTRKAAADALCVLASNARQPLDDVADSTIIALEACRFDKVKPVRDSMMEALQKWKKVARSGEDGVSNESRDVKINESTDVEDHLDDKLSKPGNHKVDSSKDGPLESSASSHSAINEGSSMQEKAVGFLKKKAPSLTDKELNPEFFQKLETRNSGDIEVVVPRKCYQSVEQAELSGDKSTALTMAYEELNETDGGGNPSNNGEGPGAYAKMLISNDFRQDKLKKQTYFITNDLKTREFDVVNDEEMSQTDGENSRVNTSISDGSLESIFLSSKGNWLGMQRQLSRLERQQVNIMNMLQEFMEGSHDSMVNLDARVRALERVVEEIARDLTPSSDRRGANLMIGLEGSPGRSSFNGTKLGRIPFAERYFSLDGIFSGAARGRDPHRRSDSEAWDSYSYIRNGHLSSRKGLGGVSVDGRSPIGEYFNDHIGGSRRAWDKGQGSSLRLGEGPSARSIWQASKDEATLEAIRVAGDDNGAVPHTATHGRDIHELDSEASGDCNQGTQQGRGPLWTSWARAMDYLNAGDVDSAYSSVLSMGDELLLLKLMFQSGPVIDQLSSDVASELLGLLGQFLLDRNSFDIALSWIQQLTGIVMENGDDQEVLSIPFELKKRVLLDLHQVCGTGGISVVGLPEDWEGPTPDQMMMQLASAWEISLQQLSKQQ